MKFESEYAKDADELLQLKTRAFNKVVDKKKRLQIVRNFTNMMNTMTEAEAKELGITEVTNHGQTYRAMAQNQSQYESMVTGTNALLDLVVDTDQPELDLITSQRMNDAINRGAIHYRGKFARFWASVAGELVIAGGGPTTQNEKYGWLPSLRTDMFFPPECSLEPDQIPYAFDPKSLTVDDLENLLKSIKDDKGVYIDKAALTSLLKKIRERIKDGNTDSFAFSEQTSKSTREDAVNTDGIPAWWFYEIKYDDNGEQYVSSTLFVDATNFIKVKKGGGCAYILAYYDKAFKSPTDWIHIPYVDSEIGGVKNMDTIRGVAEIQYNSALDMEELLNLTIQGAKMRALPKFRATGQGSVDKIAKWDVQRSMFAPEGIEELVLRGNSNELQMPLALLTNNAAGMANVGNTGNSGQLRVEAIANQQATVIQTNNKITDAYNHLDSILEMAVWRLLAGPVKPGTEGYQETMWVRAQLEKYGIDYKKLAERKYGRFVWLRVRARRVVGNGDRMQQLETAQWLMDNAMSVAPQNRPMIIHQALVLRTQDPDLADRLVQVPQAIISAQKITAENERDTVYDRASLGEIIPVNADDIHQDHIPIHMKDMQAKVAQNAVRPWDKLDLIQFAGLAMHCQEHIRILLENPETNGEAKSYMQDFQNIAQAAQRVAQDVQEREGSEQSQLTAKEQADLELKWAELNLKAQSQGLKVAEMEQLWKDREARNQLSRRSQYTKEITEDRRLKLEDKRINEQSKEQETAGVN